MTNRDSSHNFDPKHRIIGAIVVVALAVILVPIVLNQREAPSETRAPGATVLAGDGNKVAVTQVPPPVTAAEPMKAPAVVAPESANPLATSASPRAPQTPSAAVVDSKSKATAQKTPVASEAQSSAIPASGWVVQVGTFSNATNARRLEQKLRAEGQPVRTERIQLDSGKAVRLRVGPFHDRAAALKAQERIQKDVGVNGVVLAYP
ncbi:MAG TPA: SPOR domain-containing protein [Candidatus Elarobacter sp.]